MPSKVVIFGASLAGERAFRNAGSGEEVVAFIDNDPIKQGTLYCGIEVHAPSALAKLNCDIVRIASFGSREIYSELVALGWAESRIEIDYSPSDENLFRKWKQTHASRLEVFDNRHQGGDCFIIGNGPSLKEMDLSLLNDYYTIGLNKIHLIFPNSEFRPSYHVAVNPIVVEQSRSVFEQMDCPSFLPVDSRVVDKPIRDSVFYINAPESQAFSKDITQAVCQGSTVTYAAMQIAWYMGFENVFLVGVDHSFSAIGKPNETQRMGAVDPNHFDPNYFANQDWQLPDLAGSEFSYQMGKRSFEGSNPQRFIWDATVGGKLQVFPKIDYEEALEKCRTRKGLIG